MWRTLVLIVSVWDKSDQKFSELCDAECEDTETGILYKNICILRVPATAHSKA